MFARLAPQRVRHSSGYLVQVRSRESAELIDIDGNVVVVEVEFGPVSTLFADSIRMITQDQDEAPLTGDQKQKFLAQIKAGLQAMGGIYEIV